MLDNFHVILAATELVLQKKATKTTTITTI